MDIKKFKKMEKKVFFNKYIKQKKWNVFLSIKFKFLLPFSMLFHKKEKEI